MDGDTAYTLSISSPSWSIAFTARSSVEELPSVSRPGYRVFPALLMYVQMLWSRRAAETPSSNAAAAITARACS